MSDPNTRFWDKIAEKYAATPVGDQDAYERKLEMTRGYLTPDARVFEFGCGTGTTALWHAPHAAEVHAIDISPEMIRIARHKATEAGIENVQFDVAGIEGFVAAPGSFDMVMAHSILHLLEDRVSALSKAAELLKPGGYFVSSTMCLSDGLWFTRPLIAAMRLVGKAPPVWFLKGDALKAEIRAAGLEIVEDWQPGPRAALFLIARKSG